MIAAYNIINGITLYRLVAAPLLIFLALSDRIDIFKWLLAISFFTDAIDGWLARKFKVASVLGARLDSIGDDLTVAAGVVGLWLTKPEFVEQQLAPILLVLSLFVIQTIAAFVRYKRVSNFHTYLAKCAAVFQGTFLILFFFLPEPVYILFYATIVITTLELIEEIILVILLKDWKVNVKGLFWVIT